MKAESIVSRFGQVQCLPASYLPPPYGSRRGAVDAFARSPGRAAYPIERPVAWRVVEPGSAKQRAMRAADFGHDNLAWSRPYVRRGRGRAAWAAVGGALSGATLALWLGAMPVGSGTFSGGPVDTQVLATAHAPERASVAGSGDRGDAPPMRELSVATAPLEPDELIGPHDLNERPAVVTRSTPDDGAPPGVSIERSRISDVQVAERGTRRTGTVRIKHAPPVVRATRDPQPALPPPAPSRHEACGDDWPCGETLRSMRIELANWEAELAQREQADPPDVQPAASGWMSEHTRLSDR